MRVLRGLALTFVALVVCPIAFAQAILTLDDLNTRNPKDYSAAHAGEEVTVRGTLNAPPFHFPEYTVVTIQEGHAGAALHTLQTSAMLDGYQPGDMVEATGSVIVVAGMVMVDVERATRVKRVGALLARRASPEGLRHFAMLGDLVTTKGPVIESGSTTGGNYIMIGGGAEAYRIFFPSRDEGRSEALPAVRPGDEIEVAGVAFQYAPGRPPYNRGFELLAFGPPVVTTAALGWWLSPLVVLGAIAVVAGSVLLIGGRERRLRRQRELLRKTYQVGEEIFGASSIEQILKRLEGALPAVMGVTRVRLYLYNRNAKQLDAVGPWAGEPEAISLSTPPDGPHAGAVACFHYRSLLSIPDVSKSPFPVVAGG